MKKVILRIVQFIIIIAVVFSVYAFISGKTYLFKAVYHNFAAIDDYKIFTNNTVTIAQPQPWHQSNAYNKLIGLGIMFAKNNKRFGCD